MPKLTQNFVYNFSNHLNLYERRCKCNESDSLIKERTGGQTVSKGRPLPYPIEGETKCKTFQIKYEKHLSLAAKLLLRSFQNKYLYYAIDDILYSFKSDLREQNDLLAILYLPILSLQNNFFINFFDIWIHEIYINQEEEKNKFLEPNLPNYGSTHYITIKFVYKIKPLVKKAPAISNL